MSSKANISSSSSALAGLDPLRDLLGDIVGRLETLEAKVGVTPTGAAAAAVTAAVPSAKSFKGAGEVPAVKAYDVYIKESVHPLTEACDNLKGLENMGDLLLQAFEGIRTIVVLASRAKLPVDEPNIVTALQPHLTSTQQAIQSIRELKLNRDWDRHQKAVTEMLGCLSWVILRAPQTLPVPMVKETLASAEFWSNRIRKEFKGKDETQIAFCDGIKTTVDGLAEYVNEYHKIGLTFNPRGVSLAEAAIRLSDEAETAAAAAETDEQKALKSPVQKRHPTLGTNVVAGGNLAGVMGELAKRKTADGSSAATGLKHVSKDQQTWRKEYKGSTTALPPAPSLDAASTHSQKKKSDTGSHAKKKPLRGLPILEYQDRGFKWVIENQTKETALKESPKENGVLTVDISDPKQQVYLYNCEGITVKVNGKFKSLVLDKCEKCAIVYETLISGTEMVNCKKLQLQVNGLCPVFTIDKTVNVLIYLMSKEALTVSTFTTSLSSEMNVSFPDGDDQKELPIPEQFVHKLLDGAVKSEVSDLYH